MRTSKQFYVDLQLEPLLKKRNYALWVLPRIELAKLLMGSLRLHNSWRLIKTTKREVKEGQFHPAARRRHSAPAPVREFLAHLDSRETSGRILYHGIGRDEPGLEAMSRGGRDEVVGFDPYHPDLELRELPTGRFDEVFSIYTLNVVPAKQGIDILGEIFDVLEPAGKAVIAVRRDI